MKSCISTTPSFGADSTRQEMAFEIFKNYSHWSTSMRKFLLLAIIINLCLCLQVRAENRSQNPAKPQTFSFGGFRLMMSEADQKKAFPSSVIQHSDYSDYITVAPQDRKDLVTVGSIFKQKNQPHVAQLGFSYDIDPNKPADYYRDEFKQYPRCETVLKPLIQRYGAPIRPGDEQVEGLMYSHYLWETDKEKLVLFCARYVARKGKKTFASAVQISRNLPNSGCKRRTCIDPLP